MSRVIGCLLAMALAAPAGAAELLIVASALFEGRAMLTIDGETRMLRAGQTSPEGVKLVSASAREAVIEVDGKRRTLQPGRYTGGGFETPERRQVSVPRNALGQYRVGGSINGHAVTLLVDTGAYVVALSGTEATRLGIDYRSGTRTAVVTAAGPVVAWEVMLDRVELSGILVRNVQATVLEGVFPQPALLGMSFLSRVALREEGGVLYLQER